MDKLIYLSGPISNTADNGYRFNKAQDRLWDSWRVINPAKIGNTLPEMSYEEIMRIDLFLLIQCDAIYMMKGWEESAGCQLEYDTAVETGLEIYYESEEKL